MLRNPKGVNTFLARPAFSLLRPRSSNRSEAEAEAEEAEEDKVLSLLLKL